MLSSIRLRALPLAALMAIVLGVAAAPAHAARSPIRVGIGDQGRAMFDSPYYKALGLKTTRYFFPWNGMGDDYQLSMATQYVQRARAAGVSVLLHLSTDDFTLKQARLPSLAAYTKQVKKIVPYFRALGVHEWGAWNEANHASQPTYRDPKRAAQFFRAMYQVVGSKEKIVALDVLDQAGVDRYERTFFGYLSPTYRRRAKVIGLHNYGDVNRGRTAYTSLMIRMARHYNPQARFWFTETGGLVEFGRSFTCSTARAAVRTKSVLALAERYRPFGVERVYFYNWTGPGCGKTRFDSGLVDRHGKPRKAYATLRIQLRGYSR